MFIHYKWNSTAIFQKHIYQYLYVFIHMYVCTCFVYFQHPLVSSLQNGECYWRSWKPFASCNAKRKKLPLPYSFLRLYYYDGGESQWKAFNSCTTFPLPELFSTVFPESSSSSWIIASRIPRPEHTAKALILVRLLKARGVEQPRFNILQRIDHCQKRGMGFRAYFLCALRLAAIPGKRVCLCILNVLNVCKYTYTRTYENTENNVRTYWGKKTRRLFMNRAVKLNRS